MVRFKRLVEFFNRSLGVGWKRILHKRGIMSEDSTARWMFNQQLPRWVSLNKLEDHAATMGFVPGPRKGRQARAAARRSVPVAAAESAHDRALRALSGEAQPLENWDIAAAVGPPPSNFLPTSRPSVSISPDPVSLNKDQAVQLDFLSSLSPNDLQK
jgi:hypothetical protein